MLGLTGLPVLLVAAVTSLVLRFLRNREQRQQIKWFLASVGLALLVIVPLDIADAVSTSFDGPPDAVFLLALGSIPLATGIAILKYRLYEIDRLVNRAVVYAAVTALLVGAYFGIVLGLQEVFASFGGGSDLAIAISTLAVAALFRPLRARVQRAVDRRFYRRRYDAQRTLEAFSARLRDEIDIQALHGELTAVVSPNARTCAGLALAPGPGSNGEPADSDRLAWAVSGISLALPFAALAFLVLNRGTPDLSIGSQVGDALFGVALFAFPTVGRAHRLASAPESHRLDLHLRRKPVRGRRLRERIRRGTRC